MDILRFITAGSVDDGKSTLIGRLLYDSKNILADQLEAIERVSRNNESGNLDLALLTDGLRAEREQGITIDVAYKYCATPKRKFIIIDAPGHVQYTRNMITGASNADLIIILADARNGIQEQTRRHSLIASLLHIPNVVVAVNKLDLAGYSEQVFEGIRKEYEEVARKLKLERVTYIPISALHGDNIVHPSEQLSWYKGPTLLDHLETVSLRDTINLEQARFPVQYIIRPQTQQLHDYRGYAGKIISGIYRKGDAVTLLPSGLTSSIAAIESGGREVDLAFAPQSVVLRLEDDVDVSRGDQIVKSGREPATGKDFELLVCWMDNKPLLPGNRYLLQLNSTRVKSVVQEIVYKLDIHSLEEQPADGAKLNEIVKIKIRTATPLAYDTYESLNVNGGLIFIDETSNVTVGAGMIQPTRQPALN